LRSGITNLPNTTYSATTSSTSNFPVSSTGVFSRLKLPQEMVTPIFKSIPTLPLNDGCDIPQLGLASYRRDPEEKLREILLRHLDNGIRHVEICDLFGNGHTICDTILEGGAEIRRDKLYLTLKIWPKQRTREDIIMAVKEFLNRSNLESIDLLLIHGPLDAINRIDQYKAMEELKQDGFVRSIGLSNMTHTQLSNILKKCNICPAVVEVLEPIHNPIIFHRWRSLLLIKH
jgi:diketogulonate reductase-like aldo/keto reductase